MEGEREASRSKEDEEEEEEERMVYENYSGGNIKKEAE